MKNEVPNMQNIFNNKMNTLKEHIPEFIFKEIERLTKNGDVTKRDIIINYSNTKKKILFTPDVRWKRCDDFICIKTKCCVLTMGTPKECPCELRLEMSKECMDDINRLSTSLI